MDALGIAAVVVAACLLLGLALAIRVVQQYQLGVQFRLGRIVGVRNTFMRKPITSADVDAEMERLRRRGAGAHA